MTAQDILTDLTNTVKFSGFFVTKTAREGGDFQLFLARRNHVAHCSCCGRFCGIFYDSKMRSIRDLNWGETRVYLRVNCVRVDCPTCGVKAEKLPFAPVGSAMTHRFQRFLGEMCRSMTRADVAFLYGVSEDTVTRCEMDLLKGLKEDPNRFAEVTKLRIDEIARRKGHNYLTIFVNAQTGQVLDVLEGRSMEDIGPFFEHLGKEGCARIEAVCIDMSRSYIAALERWCPQAKIVFDRFHVVKHLNEALNNIRKSFQRQAPKDEKEEWRHSRRALGKNEENLTEKETECLGWLKANCPELFTVYQLKVEFQQLWEYPTQRGANIFLTRWLQKAYATDYEEFIEFCQMVENHRAGIMNYYKYPLTNGPQEGLNNKLNVIRRRAYGYRNMYSFSLKIFQATTPKKAMGEF